MQQAIAVFVMAVNSLLALIGLDALHHALGPSREDSLRYKTIVYILYLLAAVSIGLNLVFSAVLIYAEF